MYVVHHVVVWVAAQLSINMLSRLHPTNIASNCLYIKLIINMRTSFPLHNLSFFHLPYAFCVSKENSPNSIRYLDVALSDSRGTWIEQMQL
jgi:hypothetical protein